MDPLSILAGVLGVTAITAESAKRLCELLDAVRSAPNEIKNISRDTQAFYSILFSLESSLRDAEVTAVIARDENLTALVGNLEGPLKNCRSVLGQLMVKIQGFVRPLDEEGWRMSSNDFKWWWGKREIRDLTARVEVTKATLDVGLTAVGTFCNLRMMAAGNKVPGRPIRRGSNDTDAGFALRKFVEERDEALQEASSLAPPSPHADDFHTRLRLDSDTTLQGTEPSRSSEQSVSKIEQLRRAENQRNALLEATRQGDTLLIHVAIEEGAEVNAKGPEGRSAMHEAAIHGHVDIIHVLLELKADVDIRQTPRGDATQRKFQGSRTPLHWAAEKGHIDVVRLLLDNKADINAKNSTDRTPLQEAITKSHTSVAELLLDRGASIDIHDDEGWTPLHQAAHRGNVQLIHRLHRQGCDLEAKTSDNSISDLNRFNVGTPLYFAAANGHEGAVKALLQLGAEPRCRNITGEMPIHVACWRGYPSVVRILLDAGVDIEEKDLAYEETPLLKAASTGQTGVLGLLLDRGANLNAETQWGRNALRHAQLHRKEGNEEAVLLLQQAYKKRDESIP